MKFLVIQTAFIGDVILATPIVEKLRRFFPAAEIDFLLRKGNETLLTGHPQLRKIWIWDKKQGKYRNWLALLRQLRRERYDWVVNCQRFAASGLLTALSGAKRTVGFDKNPFAPFFSVRAPHQLYKADAAGQNLHETMRNLALIRHLTDDSAERPRLYPAAADFAKAQEWVAGRPYVCIAPTSVWFTKQWPAHKWVELIGRLPADQVVFLLGSRDDEAVCALIRRLAGPDRIENAAGRLSFLESAALMQGAALNYVNDSAPMHLASAVNAPVAAVFCSTIPAFGFTPLSERSFVVESSERLPCRPCGLHGYAACPQGHFACAESIAANRLPLP